MKLHIIMAMLTMLTVMGCDSEANNPFSTQCHTNADCPTDYGCKNTQCVKGYVGPECTFTGFQCVEQDVVQCIDETISIFDTCLPNETCQNGECIKPCNFDGNTCKGNKLITCKSGVEQLIEECTNGCLNNSCIGNIPSCTYTEKTCKAGNVYQCIGGNESLVETCSNGCVNGICIPNNNCSYTGKTCKAGNVYQCIGGNESLAETCSNGCVDGVCIPNANCSYTQKTCKAGNVYQCIGGNESLAETCSIGCVDGACIPVVTCTYTGKKCKSGSVHQCISGNESLVEKCSNGCSEGACLPSANKCTSNGRFCMDKKSLYECMNGQDTFVKTCKHECDNGLCKYENVSDTPGSNCNPSTYNETCTDDYTYTYCNPSYNKISTRFSSKEKCVQFLDPRNHLLHAGLQIGTCNGKAVEPSYMCTSRGESMFYCATTLSGEYAVVDSYAACKLGCDANGKKCQNGEYL